MVLSIDRNAHEIRTEISYRLHANRTGFLQQMSLNRSSFRNALQDTRLEITNRIDASRSETAAHLRSHHAQPDKRLQQLDSVSPTARASPLPLLDEQHSNAPAPAPAVGDNATEDNMQP